MLWLKGYNVWNKGTVTMPLHQFCLTSHIQDPLLVSHSQCSMLLWHLSPMGSLVHPYSTFLNLICKVLHIQDLLLCRIQANKLQFWLSLMCIMFHTQLPTPCKLLFNLHKSIMSGNMQPAPLDNLNTHLFNPNILTMKLCIGSNTPYRFFSTA